MLITTIASYAGLVLAEPLAIETTVLNEQPGYEAKRIYAGELSYRRHSQLGFEFPGKIATIMVDEGDQVSAGMVLLELDTQAMSAQLNGAHSRLETAKAQFEAQKAQLTLTQLTLQRHERLVADGHTSRQTLDEMQMQYRVESARTRVMQTQIMTANADAKLIQVNIDKSRLIAPFDGRITKRMLDEGSIVSPGQSVIAIAEHTKMEARIGMPQSSASQLSINRSYDFRIDSHRVAGTLKTILPSVDKSTATVTAVFSLDARDLYDGAMVEMYLPFYVAEPGYWVPLAALAESQRGLWSVMVVRPDGDAKAIESRLVEILYRGNDAVYVRGTLRTGESIVASGTSRIVPRQAVTQNTDRKP